MTPNHAGIESRFGIGMQSGKQNNSNNDDVRAQRPVAAVAELGAFGHMHDGRPFSTVEV
jgi:hypothetical protein